MSGESSSLSAEGDPAYHVPVLAEQVLTYLMNDNEGLYIDATVGGGGHAEQLCRHLRGTGRLVGFDADEEALAHARVRLAGYRDRVTLLQANFRTMRATLEEEAGRVAGILMDLGVSSHQLDEPVRGFSFRSEDRLDMRMDRRQPLSAWDVVNSYPEEKLADILFHYGEERAARRIARRIAASRPVDSTRALAGIVEGVTGPVQLNKSLARVFQAIRIEVNGELQSLEDALPAALGLLRPGGRVVVISYHSLEDRIVKNFFRKESAASIPSGHQLIPDTPRVPALRILTKHPVTAEESEMALNPRARSAKLRAAERLGNT